jgi:hypothetical protein
MEGECLARSSQWVSEWTRRDQIHKRLMRLGVLPEKADYVSWTHHAGRAQRIYLRVLRRGGREVPGP